MQCPVPEVEKYTTSIPKAAATAATFEPMLPMPTMPMVLPLSSMNGRLASVKNPLAEYLPLLT